MRRAVFPNVESDEGVSETHLHSWKDFHRVVQELLDSPSYVFRGQRDSSWPLEPSLTRLVRSKARWKPFENSYLGRFRLALRGRIDDSFLTSAGEDELLAVGQHFGLATPLLDWTTSPYVALFFAFEQSDKRGRRAYRAVYALDEGFVANPSGVDGSTNVRFVRPKNGFNKRFVNQGGLFTRSPLFTNIQECVANQFPNVGEAILIKINIPSAGREDCLKALNRMNINHATLFPDIDGASHFCNMQMEIRNY